MELNTRQGYSGIIDKYLLDAFGPLRMNEILPAHVRAFLRRLQDQGASAHTLTRCKTVLSAIFTTALNDQVIYFHPCTGVKTPTPPKRPLRILTPREFTRLLDALPGPQWRLLVELAVESGVRWGELAELRVGDLRRDIHVLTVVRTLVELNNPNEAGRRFVVKHYPKNTEYRHLRLRAGLVERLAWHISAHGLSENDLLFTYPGWTARTPDDDTDPPEQIVAGRKTGHGLRSKYNRGCRCQRCRTAYARFRARRRAQGKDHPRTQRLRDTDGHLGRDWFRRQIWYPALAKAGISRRVRMHDLRHTHASWLLAGGADVETVRERLGHTSPRATERYLHTLPDFTDTAITALDTIRGAA